MTFDSASFKSTLRYDAQASVEGIQQAVAEIREIDKANEPQQKLWGRMSVLGFIGAFVCLVLGAANEWTFLMMFAGFVLIFAIFSVVKWRIHKRLNFVDERYEMLAGVVRLLGRDMASDAQMQVRLDVGPANHKSKFTRKGKAGHWNVKYYDDAWLVLDGRLLDGTTFQLMLVEKFQVRSRWKRSASGKQKLKTKTKTATAAILRLKPKTTKYMSLEKVSEDVEQAIQLPQWVQPKGIRRDETGFVLKTATGVGWDVPTEANPQVNYDGVNMVAMMFLSLYQVLNLSKAITKSERSR